MDNVEDNECLPYNEDKDNEYLQLSTHHTFLIVSSHTSLISAIYCIHIGIPYYWIYLIGVYINSINYWRNPVCGIRRNMDMTWGCTGLAITIMYVYWNLPNSQMYYWWTFMACAMYPISYLFYWKKYYIISTMIHSLIHLFGNIGNVSLFNQIKNFHCLIK